MGRRNFLIEGSSGSGKTSVCEELVRRGYHAIHGDRELAYQGAPDTGEEVDVSGLEIHHHQIWHLETVKTLVRDRREEMTFFCGGSRNLMKFVDLFDAVFVLEVDVETLTRRLDARADDEWGGRGRHTERDLILRLHRTKEDMPRQSILIDATAPLTEVVDEILERSRAAGDADR